MSVQPRVPAMVVATEALDVQDDEEEGRSRKPHFNVCLNSLALLRAHVISTRLWTVHMCTNANEHHCSQQPGVRGVA
jgi:hypothetical protein